MNKRVFEKGVISSLVSALGPVIVILAVILILMFALGQAEESGRSESLRMLEEAIFRAAIHSYAVNGYFPESLEDLTANYGIFIDRSRFVVHYEVVGINLFPNIVVLDINE